MIEILLIFNCLVSLPVFVLFIQVLMAMLASTSEGGASPDHHCKIAVLIPAHNEKTVIREVIESIKAQLNDADIIYVVADNCSDNTADIAVNQGAKVLVRVDPDKHGKGYALDFGISHIRLADELPEVVVIIDADCIVEDGSISELAATCMKYYCPVQALYLMGTVTNSPRQKIAEFAWIVKNHVRPLGYLRMGLPCQLMGTGMAFPLGLLDKVNMASSNIVEDIKLGIDLAKLGYSPRFCPTARVESVFPSEDESSQSQRTRWEHGHLSSIITEGFGLLRESLRQRNIYLLAMYFDLLVPPLALLPSILLTSLMVTGLTYFVFNVGGMPLTIITSACLLFCLSILLAWRGFGRQVISFRELLGIPGYVISKIPMYIRFWSKRQKDWVRTNRD